MSSLRWPVISGLWILALIPMSARADVLDPRIALTRAKESAPVRRWPPPAMRDLGDVIEDALPIPSLPFDVTGNSCGYVDDYDEVCPYNRPGSPDVVYAYNCPEFTTVDVDLCASGYDTKVYVYEDGYTPGAPYACSDDYCGYQSFISDLALQGGSRYYFVVDGYDGDCGEFRLKIEGSVPCVLECPPGGIVEGEPVCGEGYEDRYNGGCCCDTIAFTPIEPSEGTITICGQGGTFLVNGMQYRDSDWYEIAPEETSVVTYCSTAEFPMTLALIDGRGGCANFEIMKYASGSYDCEEVCIVDTLAPGVYWLWNGSSVFEGVACGSDYLMTVSGYHPPVSTAIGFGPRVPSATVLDEPRPNPFNPCTSIRFALPERARVDLELYDTAGRRVAVLASGVYQAGEHTIPWNGLDDAGRQAPSGTYLARFQAGEYRAARKMVLLK